MGRRSFKCVVANPENNFDGCVQLNDLLDLLQAYGNCAEVAEESWQWYPLEYQGYDYATVLIGEQCWFAENSTRITRTAIPSSNLSDSEWSNHLTDLRGTPLSKELQRFMAKMLVQ